MHSSDAPRWNRIGALCAAALVAPSGATAAAASPIAVSAHIPSVVLAGHPTRVRGTVPGRARVALEQRVGGRWVVRARARSGRGAFSLRWRPPPRRGVVRVRVAAVRTDGRKRTTRTTRVAVTPTRILAPSRVAAAPAPGARGTLRYDGTAAIRPGGFVALGTGPRTPAGLLARVVTKRSENGDTLLDLEPASLTDAIPVGHFVLSASSSLRSSPQRARAGTRSFGSPLHCGAGVEGSVEGSLALSLDPKFDLSWSWGAVTHAKAAVTLRGDAALAASISAAGTCLLDETAVASWDAPPLRTFVGPIPVVVVPHTTLLLSAAAEAKAAVEAGLDGHLTAAAGLTYHGSVHPTGSFEPSFSFTPPAPHGAASLDARVIPSVTFLLYGQAGPRFDMSTGLHLDAEPGATPWWTLTAPVELRAGLSVPHLDSLSVPQQTVFSRKFPLAQAPADDSPAGATGDAMGRRRARIAWNTGSTDVDLHVWDSDGNHASYEAPGAIAGGLLSADDRDGFGPESFSDDGGGDGDGRSLTFGLCYFDDRGRGPTTVDVELADADGTTRRLTRTLTRMGEGVLLGPSGDGERAFVPSDGWCTAAP